MTALHSTVDGSGPTLILGASLGTTGAMWSPQVPTLAQQFTVVRYDHRGHGASDVPPGPYAIADLAGDVLELADSLGVARFDVAGASMGSFVALWLAQHHPSRIGRLILIGTAARTGSPQFWAERAQAVRSGGMAAVASTVVGRWLPPGLDKLHASLMEQVLATPVEGYAACCEAIGAMDLTPDLGAVTAPTLVIAGSLDQSTPPSLGQAVAAGIPGASFELIDGAAHLANLSHPDQVTRLLQSFLTA